MRLGKRIFVLAFSLILIGTFAKDLSYANAASLQTNIFSEELEDECLEDSNKWITSKADSEIDIQNVGSPKLCFASTAMQNSFQYPEKVTIGTKQYLEYVITLEGMVPTAVVDFVFSSEKGTAGNDIAISESVSFYTDSWLRGELHSSTARTIYSSWGNSGPAESATGLQWVNGNNTLGCVHPETGKYSMKVRLYDDGTALYYVANPYEENWFLFSSIGYGVDTSTWTWKESDTKFAPFTSGYPSIVVRNCAEVFVGQFELGVYSYESILGQQADNPFPDGTIVGEKYVDDTEDAGATALVPVQGELTTKASLRAIYIDSKADDDLLVKKVKLSVPANNFADIIYNLDFELVLGKFEGNAKAVIYFSDDDEDMSSSLPLSFYKAADGKIMVRAGDADAVETKLTENNKFNLLILTKSEWENEVYVNNEKVLSFVKDISGKYIAFGTKDVTISDRAAIGVVAAHFKRYDYKQGTGGDFVETFDEGRYNSGNIAFAYAVEDLSPFFYADAEGGNLVVENVGYTGVISTKQMYGDFEFSFEISELNTNPLSDGTEAPCNFNISWGRPAPESDYAAGGCGLYMVWGNDFNIMGNSEVKFETGYSPWCSLSLPTDKVDDNGQPLGRSGLIWDYNFSEGNLVFKVIKKGDRAELYMYTANSDPESVSRTRPISVIVNDYSYGCVGICGVPTGKNMAMKIDKFSIKNLDEHKASNLYVAGQEYVSDLDFRRQEEEEIVDPFASESMKTDSETTTNSKKGCKSQSEGLPMLLVLAAVSIFILRKRRNN